MARFSTAAKALRGPFKKLIAKLALKLKRVLIRRPGKRTYPVPGAAKDAVERDLRDLSTLRGATPEEVRRIVPDDWVEKPLKKGEGVRFGDPKRPGDMVAIERGVPGHADPLHSGPYVKVSLNGHTERIPLLGNPVLGDE
jgi:hypothetical protein